MLNKLLRKSFLVMLDVLIVLFSIILAFGLRYDNLFQWFSPVYDEIRILIMLVFAFSAILANALFDCYNNVWKMAGIAEAIRQSSSSAFAMILNFTLFHIFDIFYPARLLLAAVPYSIILIAALFQFLLMSLVRFTYRILSESLNRFARFFFKSKKVRVIIYGNIIDAKIIIEKLRNDNTHNKVVTAIIDERLVLSNGANISGVRVFDGGLDTLKQKIKNHSANEVIISSRNLDKNTILSIIHMCKHSKCGLKVFKGIEDYNLGKDYLREINIEDLLGRTPTQLDVDEIKKFIFGKTILVTGGAGSIGSEICRQALKCQCNKLIIYDHCENGLFALENELLEHFDKSKIKVVVGSVRDEARLADTYSKYKPEVVFHAAAHKHVPLMEANPIEAIKNNVFGTYNVARLAVEFNVDDFILISTDKAVNPKNIMGATKRIGEMIIQSLNNSSKYTRLAAVRFGNVLGSSGSVIPLFKKQIEKGGPITVTHPEIKRYFMTIPEAVQLVMRAASMANGGEIFILDMGEPVKILDLAKDMIRLSGYEPEKDIKIVFTGLRPGEKMFEELSYNDEFTIKTKSNKIFICNSNHLDKNFMTKLEKLRQMVKNEADLDCRIALKDIVREYDYTVEHQEESQDDHDEGIVDLTSIAGYVGSVGS